MTTSAPEKEQKAIPGIPAKPLSDVSDLYVLTFIHKASSAHTQNKVFRHSGEFKDVVQRAKAHCEQMSYRFIYLKPFISDLVEEEKKQQALGY